MPAGDAYRQRARRFERLAERQEDDQLKASLRDLAKDCAKVAAAMERNPELAVLHDMSRTPQLH
jgi:hypothetical protein